jgi:hypothetical protein
MAAAVERKYQMVRVGAGDYLLPSNDGLTLWRIHRYHENGSLEISVGDGKTKKVVGDFWACHRMPMPDPDDPAKWPGDEELTEWPGAWKEYAWGYVKRQDAITDALKARAAR